ncbi:uncharacterized protein LOC142093606 isoform X3 [Calonectris borealis]|uniref:uncharacterized protein LOC142093606 isoform X3 n=1 Tax=Calonectris borealis TaxID=1323832 RepID=UPI003F4BD94E
MAFGRQGSRYRLQTPGGGTDLLPEPTPPAAIRGSHRLLRGWEAALAVCRKERDYLIPTASEINPHYGFVPGEEETDFHSQPVLNRYLKVHAPIPGNVPPTIPVRKIVVTSAGPASLLSSSRVPPPNPGRVLPCCLQRSAVPGRALAGCGQPCSGRRCRSQARKSRKHFAGPRGAGLGIYAKRA